MTQDIALTTPVEFPARGKLTAAVYEVAVRSAAKGASLRIIAGTLRITPRCLLSWRVRGRTEMMRREGRDSKGEPLPPEAMPVEGDETWVREEPYYRLYVDMTAATAGTDLKALDAITTAFTREEKQDWKAGGWFLERRHKEYSRHETRDTRSQVEQRVTVKREKDSERNPKQAAEYIARVQEELRLIQEEQKRSLPNPDDFVIEAEIKELDGRSD